MNHTRKSAPYLCGLHWFFAGSARHEGEIPDIQIVPDAVSVSHFTDIIATLPQNVHNQPPSPFSMTAKNAHFFLLGPMESKSQCTPLGQSKSRPIYYVCNTNLPVVIVLLLLCTSSDNIYAKLASPCLPWPLRWVPSSKADCQVPQQTDRTCDSPSECRPHTATPPHHPVENNIHTFLVKNINKLRHL